MSLLQFRLRSLVWFAIVAIFSPIWVWHWLYTQVRNFLDDTRYGWETEQRRRRQRAELAARTAGVVGTGTQDVSQQGADGKESGK